MSATRVRVNTQTGEATLDDGPGGQQQQQDNQPQARRGLGEGWNRGGTHRVEYGQDGPVHSYGGVASSADAPRPAGGILDTATGRQGYRQSPGEVTEQSLVRNKAGHQFKVREMLLSGELCTCLYPLFPR